MGDAKGDYKRLQSWQGVIHAEAALAHALG
jgi:hypothetical protein